MQIEIKELVGAIFLTIDEMRNRYQGELEKLQTEVDNQKSFNANLAADYQKLKVLSDRVKSKNLRKS